MDTSFWHQRWEQNEIGFHGSEVNPLLVKHVAHLSLEQGNRVFLPMCGKTLDIAWLLANGYQIVGVELSNIAIEQLFSELGVVPTVTTAPDFIHYKDVGIDIFVGDFFKLTDGILGHVHAVYDRAALVALPKEMRQRYTAHLRQITHSQQQLLICYEYDQHVMEGPPFSISEAEVHQHYSASYDLKLLASEGVEGGLKGICPATENVWLLQGK